MESFIVNIVALLLALLPILIYAGKGHGKMAVTCFLVMLAIAVLGTGFTFALGMNAAYAVAADDGEAAGRAVVGAFAVWAIFLLLDLAAFLGFLIHSLVVESVNAKHMRHMMATQTRMMRRQRPQVVVVQQPAQPGYQQPYAQPYAPPPPVIDVPQARLPAPPRSRRPRLPRR